MFGLDKKKVTTLSDELFGKQNLEEIMIRLTFKGYRKGVSAKITYTSGSLEGNKRIKGEDLQDLLNKIELFVNELK